MKIAHTVDEVLEKYSHAEKMDCPMWERVTIFTWGDMEKLRAEILDFRAKFQAAKLAYVELTNSTLHYNDDGNFVTEHVASDKLMAKFDAVFSD